MKDDILDEDQVRGLSERAALLPREIEPPADAWSVIGAAIQAEPRGVHSMGGENGLARRHAAFWQRPAFLAAAGLALVAGSSGITAIALDRRAAPAEVFVAESRPVSGAPATLAEFTLVENEYIGTANRLAEMLESDESQLSPETIAKLKESLKVIDAAILEARRVLAADPANQQLMEMLSNSYNQKLDLLRRTAEMGRS